ncbi:MAG: DUF4395 domain-containing protein [Ornithinibacter sp.]
MVMGRVRTSFEYPALVNDKAARVVAAGVVLMTGLALLTGWLWLSALLAAGFALRAVAGPRFSPLGRLAAKVVAPRLGEPKMVSGPPKRFAQSIGVVLTTVAAVSLALGAPVVAFSLLAVVLVFATLEAAVGFCAGCFAFAQLMRVGLIPPETCEACNDLSLRRRETAAA